MRLEPVLLVAPRPQPPAMSSRRAFLIASGTFVAGSMFGGACGYSIGAAGGGVGGEVVPESTGNAELDELRRLAVKAPIEELVEVRLQFLNSLTKDYSQDSILWAGVDRLCKHVVDGGAVPDRRLFSRWLAQVIEGNTSASSTASKQWVVHLRKIK